MNDYQMILTHQNLDYSVMDFKKYKLSIHFNFTFFCLSQKISRSTTRMIKFTVPYICA